MAVLLAASLSVGLLPSVAFASHNDDRVDPCASTPAARELTDRDLARMVHVASIDCVYNRRITVGSVDAAGRRVYEPTPEVTRGQMASFIARTLVAGGYDVELPAGDGAPEFGDVAGSTHLVAINRLARAGIVRGTSPGTYLPDASVTRQQMAAFMVRAARFALGDEHPIVRDAVDRFADVLQGNVHKADIEAGADAVPALFQGVSASSFQPATAVQRDQMATFLVNLLRSIFRVATAPPPIVPGPSPGPSPSPSPNPSPSPSPSASPDPSDSPSPSPNPSGSPSPSPNPSGSPSPSQDPSGSPDPSESPSASPTPTTSPSPDPGLVTVPDVVGSQQGTAITKVIDASLEIGDVRFVRSATSPAGQVLDQEPDAGARVPAGSSVGMQVSLGAKQLTIPDVVGLEQGEAADRIEQAGFALGAVRDTTSDDVEEGEVDRQLPLAGKQALPGTPVDLDVARGPVNDAPEITSSPSLTHTTGSGDYGYDAAATDPDGDDLSWTLQAGPEGAAVDEGTGELRWDAGPDDAGPHDVVVRVEDRRGGLDTQSWTVQVTRPNRAPTAVDDVLTATRGEQRVIADAELLGNDTDPDGDPLTITGFAQPQAGRVARDGAGLTYTPNQPVSTEIREDFELTHATAPATSR